MIQRSSFTHTPQLISVISPNQVKTNNQTQPVTSKCLLKFGQTRLQPTNVNSQRQHRSWLSLDSLSAQQLAHPCPSNVLAIFCVPPNSLSFHVYPSHMSTHATSYVDPGLLCPNSLPLALESVLCCEPSSIATPSGPIIGPPGPGGGGGGGVSLGAPPLSLP